MKKRWLKIVGGSLCVLVLVAFGAVGVVCNNQAQMLVHNPPEYRHPIDETPADYGLNYESLTLTTEDGYELATWYIPSENGASIIVQHGLKNNRASVLGVAEVLVRHGYGVIMVDLRACGESDGDLVTFGLYEVRDVEAAYQHLLTRPDVDPERIGAYGLSMGGVVVLLHAAQTPGIKAVVSESAYASLQDQVANGVEAYTGLPAFPFAPMIQWFAEREAGFKAKEVAPVERIASISPRPVFLLHGGADIVISPDSGQRLYDAAGEPRELWFEPDLTDGAFRRERPEEFEARVVGFFDQYLLGE